MTYEAMVSAEAGKKIAAKAMIEEGADDKTIAKALSVRVQWVRNVRKL